MPDLASTLRGVKDLINNNIENKVNQNNTFKKDY